MEYRNKDYIYPRSSATIAADNALLVCRVLIGCMALFRGITTVLGGPSKWESLGNAVQHIGITVYHDLFGLILAGMDCLAGILLIIGLWITLIASLAAVVVFCQFLVLASDYQPFIYSSRLIESSIAYLCLAAFGPGKYSLDALRFNEDQKRGVKPISTEESPSEDKADIGSSGKKQSNWSLFGSKPAKANKLENTPSEVKAPPAEPVAKEPEVKKDSENAKVDASETEDGLDGIIHL